MSGLPGKAGWVRYRMPEDHNARRKASSGPVSRLRIRDITSLRFSGVKQSPLPFFMSKRVLSACVRLKVLRILWLSAYEKSGKKRLITYA